MSLQIRVTESPDGTRSVEIKDAPEPAPHNHLHAICTAGIDVQADRAAAQPSQQPRFIKLDDAGHRLAADAAIWAAVHDTTTGLTWSTESIGGKRLNHADAKAACEKLQLAGASDWQLPTRTQLLTLVDDTRHEPAIETDFFPKTESAYYWTNTPCAWRPGSAAWCVDFGGGGVHYGVHVNECFVRAVRVASPAASQSLAF